MNAIHASEYGARLTTPARCPMCARRRERVPIADGVVIDPRQRVITVDGVRVPLGGRAYTLACLLAEQPHRIHTRSDLEAALWDGHVTGGALPSLLSRLRKALRSAAPHRAFIVNRWGDGWQFMEGGAG